MNIRLRPAPICLRKGQAALLDDARGARVHCRDGFVWVTQEGDRRDIVLQPGESLLIERDGMAVVSAVSDASVDVQAAPVRGRGVQALRSRWRTMFATALHAGRMPVSGWRCGSNG